MAEEADEQNIVAANLPAEDDEGNMEYKLMLCGVDT